MLVQDSDAFTLRCGPLLKMMDNMTGMRSNGVYSMVNQSIISSECLCQGVFIVQRPTERQAERTCSNGLIPRGFSLLPACILDDTVQGVKVGIGQVRIVVVEQLLKGYAIKETIRITNSHDLSM
jgi:hypothetical protein